MATLFYQSLCRDAQKGDLDKAPIALASLFEKYQDGGELDEMGHAPPPASDE